MSVHWRLGPLSRFCECTWNYWIVLRLGFANVPGSIGLCFIQEFPTADWMIYYDAQSEPSTYLGFGVSGWVDLGIFGVSGWVVLGIL